MKQQKLTVKPLTSYKTPKYPRVGDVDATEALRAHPYPFRSHLKSYVATVGLTTCFTQLCAAEAPAKLDSPFPVAESGLPHHTSSFGTGMPSYLSEDLATRVIDKVFSENGYQLQRNVPYTKGDDISFVADGYDSERKVGYVWGDWDSLDHRDAIVSWSKPRLSEADIDRILSDDSTDQRQFQYTLKNATRFFERQKLPEPIQVEYQKALSLSDPREQLNRFASILEQLEPVEDPVRLSLREAKALEDQSVEAKEYIALISCFDARFQYRGWGAPIDQSKQDEIEKLRLQLEKSETPEARNKIYLQIEEIYAEGALTELEAAVRSYIEWAQRQGI
ncbi:MULTISPECIES: hypothetical protein [unclassified Lentimonas]|uniref:hypothetical protein n=1 Tax=unclassified Lentimonas TaxID=2630993 RepID=UPI0013895283|nr:MULTISPECIES: hypothetical protein [unclassified Lentimonas]